MKNKIMLLIVVCCLLFNIKNVSAARLEREFIDNAWAFRYRDNKVYTYGQLNIKRLDGKIGYCIESDVNIYEENYSSTEDWSITGYTNQDKEKMQLYAYYGYEYPGHNNIKYYMATQELIWLLSKDEMIKWTKEDNSSSEVIDVSSEKNEILSLISKHNVIPSFNRQTYKTTAYDTMMITDTNNVLKNYDNDQNISYSSNRFYLNVKNKKITINFSEKSILQDKTKVFYTSDNKSQKIAVLGNPNLNKAVVYVEPVNVSIKIRKLDYDSKELIVDSGIKIKLKGVDNNTEIGPITFTNGIARATIPAGTYSVIELSTSSGYSLNTSCPWFNVTVDDKDFTYDFYNKKIKGKVRIKKTDELGNYLEGTVFNIYDINDNLVDSIVTTKEEYDESKELDLGDYYVKEISSLNGYKIDNKVYNAKLEYFNENTPIVYKDIESINEKIKCDITIISTDEDNNEINSKHEIHDKNDNIIYSGNDKEIKLDYGEYYLIQTEVPNGYKLNDKKISFKVSDDSCLTNIKIINKKVNMPITSTSINVLSVLFLIISCGIFRYYKKNN